MTMKINLKKLYYQGTHRGMREVDVILQPLMEQLDALSTEEILSVEALLNESDQDILEWIMRKTKPPMKYEGIILKILLFVV